MSEDTTLRGVVIYYPDVACNATSAPVPYPWSVFFVFYVRDGQHTRTTPRQTDRQTDRHTDRQTHTAAHDRPTHTHTERERERERERPILALTVHRTIHMTGNNPAVTDVECLNCWCVPTSEPSKRDKTWTRAKRERERERAG